MHHLNQARHVKRASVLQYINYKVIAFKSHVLNYINKTHVPFVKLYSSFAGGGEELARARAFTQAISPNFKSSVPFNRWSSKLVGTLPEMVQTIVPKDFTQYCSSPPLCTSISIYGYTLSLERIISFA